MLKRFIYFFISVSVLNNKTQLFLCYYENTVKPKHEIFMCLFGADRDVGITTVVVVSAMTLVPLVPQINATAGQEAMLKWSVHKLQTIENAQAHLEMNCFAFNNKNGSSCSVLVVQIVHSKTNFNL